MTYEQLMLPICPIVNVTVSDFHVKVFQLLESEEGSQILEGLCSLKSCGWLKNESLQYYSPKMFQDYLTTMGGATFGTIINTMAELGYSVEWQVLNSKHFGVPQNRERVFIIGHYGEGSRRQVFPIGADDPSANELQRLGVNNRVISNTLAAGDRDSVGTYIATDRQTDLSQSKRFPQGLVLNAYKKPKKVKIACTLDTKCGAIPHFQANYIRTK